MVGSQPDPVPRRPAASRATHVDLTDAEILRRGLEAFSELGYEGASVRELAKRLGVNHNFINDRFGSKNNFWRAVVDHAMGAMQSRFSLAFELGSDDYEKLEAIIKAFYSVAANAPQMNRILAAEFVLDSDRLDYIFDKYTTAMLERVEPIAQRLMDAGRMPRISTDILFTALSGPALALTQGGLARRLGRAPSQSDAEWQQITDSLAEVVLRGLLPAEPTA
ncbi:TetR/AcrR family transcriptional regulator [Catellatospora chokoriensis]|uniref:Putative transcriptional regulator, TetR n=1 Tax=Catellatospora chokoriensis TaxID=310353 RepID=A0A8J3NTT7_9ACTN|nr:TetR/AcrR family transcriptional regulator [Catellatospora chokoriensis]GIF92335.1 putative transcriptional regulator, TetR [Catellatospora chokoriensis]